MGVRAPRGGVGVVGGEGREEGGRRDVAGLGRLKQIPGHHGPGCRETGLRPDPPPAPHLQNRHRQPCPDQLLPQPWQWKEETQVLCQGLASLAESQAVTHDLWLLLGSLVAEGWDPCETQKQVK